MFGCGRMLKKKSPALGFHMLINLAILGKFNFALHDISLGETCLEQVSFRRGLICIDS
jgi:hypothetical protein